ncbi:HrpD5 family protein [Uliginosibacterium gangwonense]|uniref:HrpD5 family protein n=1 Tax=Uliginosibacterium gangwonense TaxID=392736 RepID=UPI0003A8EEA3|nr:HrpD5 family protein [Uliginosibacterium gangwonense]
MSKEIRVLTGLHAGARLALQSGIQHIGKGDDAKIRISDWDASPLWIDVSDDGQITQIRLTASTDDASLLFFGDFEPHRFGSIAIAFGNIDATWPSDLDLLEKMLRPPAPPPILTSEKQVSHGFRVKWWLAPVGAVLFGITVTSANQFGAAKPVVAVQSENAMPHLRAALSNLKQPELDIVTNGNDVILKGLVNSSADLQNVLNALNSIAPGKIQPKVTVVSDVLENLKSSVGDSYLAYRYMGAGVFQVTGVTPRAERDREILNRLRDDLGVNQTRLEVSIQSSGNGFPPNTDVVVQTENMHYVETTDGIRHFPDAVLDP